MNLFAHICEVMGLFPAAGEQVLIRLACGAEANRRNGAAVGKSRRAAHFA